MNNLKKFTIPLAAFALIATGALTTYAYQSHAQTATTDTAQVQSSSRGSSFNPMSNLVNAIAAKFNLNASDVQQVFDDQQKQEEANREQMFTDRLNQAVTDGKLTQDQANKITAKKQELESQREANKASFDSQTDAQRKAAMEQQMADLKQWATDNNIPQEFMPFAGGFGGFGGHHGGFGHGPEDMNATK